MSKKIYIDAGHGGRNANGAFDPGAVSGSRQEADDNLTMANAVNAALQRQGFQTKMSRTARELPANLNRATDANNWGADFFISIHRNAFTNASANGFETYTKVKFDKMSDDGAQAVQKRCAAVGVQSNRGVKRQDFGLLTSIKMPGVLVEYNFITNTKDNELFDKHLTAYAEATAQAVVDIFGKQSETAAPTPAPKPTAGQTAIAGKSVASAAQMTAYIRGINPNAPDLAALYLSEGEAEGIRGDVAFAQSCIETGNFTFSGGTAVTLDQNNFCGMGVVSLGVKGNSYKTAQEGIRAQIQHLKAYANTEALKNKLVEPTAGEARFKFVQRGVSPYVEWLGQKENPEGKGWAVGAGYGEKILKILAGITATAAPAPTPPAPKPSASAGTYTVVKGDTMSGIAQRHGVTLAALIAANPQIKDPNIIIAGQSINIPGKTEAAAAPADTKPKVGDRVKITGSYASSAFAQTAPHRAMVGGTAVITRVVTGSGVNYPYQLGTVAGSTSSATTIGFANADGIDKLRG